MIKPTDDLENFPDETTQPLRKKPPPEMRKDIAGQMKRAEREAQYKRSELERNNKPVIHASRNVFAQTNRSRKYHNILAEKETHFKSDVLEILNALLIEIKCLRTELAEKK